MFLYFDRDKRDSLPALAWAANRAVFKPQGHINRFLEWLLIDEEPAAIIVFTPGNEES